VTKQILTARQALRLRELAKLYKPKMGKSWRQRKPTELWLRVLSQVVVAGNAAPGYTLQQSRAVKERLAFSRLKKLPARRRRELIHRVLYVIGTRYVGKKSRNLKVDAATQNFESLVNAGGPRQFFQKIAAEKGISAKVRYLSRNLKYYKKKGCRDILIELRLASDCMALDQRIRKILEGVGVKIHGSLDRQYEQIERELIVRVAKPNHLTGGELDRVLFQNASDIMVRLLCP
jgi:hypothetical protein